ncbi:MFS transporter [Novosphingobium terrae]|uniref:MFS transporter n=1 Tax=Novosphingobium terrae TaxID=2726189 RepID=UPI002AC31C83|nr:MFS transporter [Novosphingobium terrae]
MLRMPSADTPATRLATRLAFFIAGFGIACWAPLVPFVKARLGIGDGTLGLLLLCLGTGSVLAMLMAGALGARFGTRPVILVGSMGLAVLLPCLALAPSAPLLAVTLLLFGASLGALDVGMNVHSIEVERDAPVPLLSGFHALYSVGGFAGAAMMTSLLSLGTEAVLCATIGALAIVVGTLLMAGRLLTTRAPHGEPHFVKPRGIVLGLCALAAATFLAEGALLDWGALIVTDMGLLDARHAGMGYMLFAIAMTVGRFTGDALTARIGDRAAVLWGGVIAMAGFALLLTAPFAAAALGGFVLIGLGAANIVPVYFRVAGAQTDMPGNLAVAAMTTAGYAGILLGPAIIGFIAQHAGLKTAFWMLTILLLIVPLTSGIAARKPSQANTER